MDYRDSTEQQAWRGEVRAFLEAEAPGEYRVMRRPAVDSYGRGDELFQTWRNRVARRGWLASHWPKEYGGAGMSVMEQFVLKEEFALSGCAHPGGRGVEMVGPTIILHATDEQRDELLPPILSGEHIYCQGFSEPGAGSDLAAVQLRAVRDGDENVLNGQKIWTSNALSCNWIFLLARTDPDAPKHKGISYFVMPMDVPGVTVRPIIDMVGGNELCETFYEDVRVPASYRIGEENRGWYIAMTTLDFERSGIAGAVALQQRMIRLAPTLKGRLTDERRALFADLYLSSEVARQMAYHVASLQDRGQVPNYEASMVKLFSSELTRRFDTAMVSFFGLQGQLYAGSNGYDVDEGRVARALSGSIPTTIAGGTSEVQRGIIAGGGLGLPRG
ncbi:MAG: acyl-CoA dehydrogenase family protein [Dehalococcoidia bacterium]